MTKKIAVINDLSGFGRCSLTAAISVLSAMGVSACPLPTAILTAQTEYPSYYCDDYTDKMDIYRKEWLKMGQKFDGIYTGFVASEAQIGHIFNFIDTFRTSDTFLLVDPVMGDDGITYDIFTPSLLSKMKELALKADIITPNMTELCLLTDYDYYNLTAITDTEKLMDQILLLGKKLCNMGPSHVIVTGIQFTGTDGIRSMGNLYISATEHALVAFPYIGGSYSGTGDLFACVLLGGRLGGDDESSAIRFASEYISRVMEYTSQFDTPEREGVAFEHFMADLAEYVRG
jgi:pyridoxine kinase